MAKGDQIKALIDIGSGNVVERVFEADAAGRKVEFRREVRDGLIRVEVLGRAGAAVRTTELRADRVILIEEVPR